MSRTNTLRKIDESVDPNEKKTTAWVHHNHFSRIWHIYICVCVYFIVQICFIYVQLCYSKTCVFPRFSYQPYALGGSRNHGSSWILLRQRSPPCCIKSKAPSPSRPLHEPKIPRTPHENNRLIDFPTVLQYGFAHHSQ